MNTIVIAAVLMFLAGQQILSNDAVVNLMKAGFSEDVIISAINRSQASYDTSVDGLAALKSAGITDKEISAIVARAYQQPSAALVAGGAPQAALPVPAQPTIKPRVLLRAQSHSRGWTESRDQSMEMSKDFQEVCPEVQISLNQHVDYSVQLNHTEHGFVRENQMQIANKDGDLLAKTDGSIRAVSIKGGVKKACEAILADWARK
jgi:hypothetical protein